MNIFCDLKFAITPVNDIFLKHIMRLLLHNMLFDSEGKHFKIECKKKRVIFKEFDAEYLHKICRTICFDALRSGCNDLGIEYSEYQGLQTDEDSLKSLHHILFEVDVLTGFLISETGEKHKIIGGIPDIDESVE